MVLVKSKVLSGGIKVEIPQWLNLEAFTQSCKKVYQRLKALFEILPGAPQTVDPPKNEEVIENPD